MGDRWEGRRRHGHLSESTIARMEVIATAAWIVDQAMRPDAAPSTHRDASLHLLCLKTPLVEGAASRCSSDGPLWEGPTKVFGLPYPQGQVPTVENVQAAFCSQAVWPSAAQVYVLAPEPQHTSGSKPQPQAHPGAAARHADSVICDPHDPGVVVERLSTQNGKGQSGHVAPGFHWQTPAPAERTHSA